MSLMSLMMLSVGAEAAQTGNPEAVRRHAEDMVNAAQVMVQHGGEGKLNPVIDDAKQVIAHGKEAVEAVPRSGN